VLSAISLPTMEDDWGKKITALFLKKERYEYTQLDADSSTHDTSTSIEIELASNTNNTARYRGSFGESRLHSRKDTLPANLHK